MPLYLNGTEGVYGVNGTNSTPANRGSDTNTGIVYGTDTVQIATGGTTAVTVDSSQNVGIGTASPGQKLDVNGNVRSKSSSGGVINMDATVAGTTNTIGSYNNNGGSFADLYISTNNTLFFTAGAERARIDSSGRFLMPAANLFDGVTMMQLDASAAARAALGIKAGTNNYCQTFFAYNNASLGGSITTSGTTTTFGTSSDYRLKENVQPMSGALSRIEQLHPVTYSWKADGSLGEGFIAHELQTVIPLSVIGEKDAVTEDGNIAPQQVDYAKLTPILTAAIQELSAKLDAAEARIAALEAN